LAFIATGTVVGMLDRQNHAREMLFAFPVNE